MIFSRRKRIPNQIKFQHLNKTKILLLSSNFLSSAYNWNFLKGRRKIKIVAKSYFKNFNIYIINQDTDAIIVKIIPILKIHQKIHRTNWSPMRTTTQMIRNHLSKYHIVKE